MGRVLLCSGGLVNVKLVIICLDKVCVWGEASLRMNPHSVRRESRGLADREVSGRAGTV